MNPIEAIKEQARIIYDAAVGIMEYVGPLEEAVAPLVKLTRGDDQPLRLSAREDNDPIERPRRRRRGAAAAARPAAELPTGRDRKSVV